MKALLLKDFYMTLKYCKAYLVIVFAFILGSFAVSDTLFYIFYPCVLAGMIPVTLLGYDERSGWMQYCGALPYTRAQIVSSKYITGLLWQVLVLVLSGITQAVKMHTESGFVPGDFLLLMSMLIIIACVSASLCLPFMFKYRVEKGRMAYYVMIGIVCAGSFIASDSYNALLTGGTVSGAFMPVACAIAIGLYALSWYLSVVFYKRREAV